MLLESREGNQAENYDRAKGHYRAVLERALPDKVVAVAWIATSGLANALSWDPRAGREDFETAFKLYDELLSHYGRVGDSDSLAIVLGNYSLALSKAAKLWNTVEALEKAFVLSQEAVRRHCQVNVDGAWPSLAAGSSRGSATTCHLVPDTERARPQHAVVGRSQ